MQRMILNMGYNVENNVRGLDIYTYRWRCKTSPDALSEVDILCGGKTFRQHLHMTSKDARVCPRSSPGPVSLPDTKHDSIATSILWLYYPRKGHIYALSTKHAPYRASVGF
jgi:hypothetical protein